MTPKEKAKELVNKFIEFTRVFDDCSGWVDDILSAKQCALIAVDELLEATKRYDYTLGPNPSYNQYWLKVKYQLEQL